jgi:3-oxoacyl-[acyl-carrier protein] reductase
MGYAIVTGASRGIGRATALELARRGLDVALVGRESPELRESADRAAEQGVAARRVPCDLTDTDAIESVARGLLDSLGPPAVVVHSAGVIRRGRIEVLTPKEWDEQFAVNVRAPYVLTRALLPAMKQARAGRMIFVGSISATLGTAGASGYCASKWALSGFVKSLAEELTDTGLVAMAVLPGSVDTEMLEGSGFSPRMSALDVARTLAHFALDAPLAHNGALVEMFGT